MSHPICRRTVLRGLGAAVSLPFLESLAPRVLAGAPAKPPVRMAVLYMANGINPNTWTPKGTGRSFELSPTLAPLQKVKDDLLVFTELWNAASNRRKTAN